MKLTFYPSTKTGIYTITFMIMAVILMVVVAYLGQDMEVEPEGSFFDHMNLAVMMLLAFLFSIISLVTGLLAVIRDKERSILCLGAVLVSFVAVYFGTMEFIGETNLFNLQTK
ncbi:hypothetical protein [Proteiniclasticum ruminis]|uniref:hypothetical protein n=1 Tax=Proteiniclasticum ruminis TaxID=398199 RepID=UPI0028AD4924|nr:hypothetical protein [Proteiniclasticum ruminis]